MIPRENHILPKCLIWQPAFFKCNPIFLSFILSNFARLRAHTVIFLNPTNFARPPDDLPRLSHILHLIVYIVMKWSTSLRCPVFTDVTLSRRVSISRRFEVKYCLHPEGSTRSTWPTTAIHSLTTSVNIRQRNVTSLKTGIRSHAAMTTSKRTFNVKSVSRHKSCNLSSLRTFL